jgi:hypothetical protein
MTHPDTKHMLELVEQQTGYRVSVDLISGIHEHARMISARPGNPVHMISVNSSQHAFADYIVAVQCGILLALWSDPQKVPAIALEERATTALADRWAGLPWISPKNTLRQNAFSNWKNSQGAKSFFKTSR